MRPKADGVARAAVLPNGMVFGKERTLRVGLCAAFLVSPWACRAPLDDLPATSTPQGAGGHPAEAGGASGESSAGGGGDAAGADAGAPEDGGAAGAGGDGSGGAASCECADDGLACNGVEACEGGECVSTMAPECPGGTACVERGEDPSCEYVEPSAWLLFEAGKPALEARTKLMTIPLARIGKDEPSVLLELPERFPNNSFKQWSPSGDILLFDQGWFQLPEGSWESQLLWSRYGNGLPTPPRLIPNLPSTPGSSYWVEDMDAETDSALVSSEGELFFVKFGAAAAEPALVLSSEESFEAWLCKAASSVVLLSATGDARVLPLPASDANPYAIGAAGSVHVSPTREHVVFELVNEASGQYDVALGHCGPEPALTTIATFEYTPSVSWAPDGRHLIVSGTYDDAPIFRLIELGTDVVGAVLFEEDGQADDIRWSPRGDEVALFLAGREDSAGWWRLALERESLERLPADVAGVADWAQPYLIVWDAAGSLLALDADPDSSPVLVAEGEEDEITWILPDAAGTHFLYYGADGELYLVDAANPAQSTLLEAEALRGFSIDTFLGIDHGILATDDPGSGPGTAKIAWVPLRGGVPGEAAVFTDAYYPELQPRP